MNYRRIFGVVILGSCLFLPAGAATAAPTQDQALSDATDFRGTPLGEAIAQLCKTSGKNFFVNWRALEQQKVTRALPVTVDLSHRSFDEALTSLLKEVGGTHVQLAWVVDEDVITISTADDFSTNVCTRIYDIRRAIKSNVTHDKNLLDLVNRVCGIDPLSWKTAGGSVGSLREVSGQLIVTQTPQMQKRIAEELRDILPAEQVENAP